MPSPTDGLRFGWPSSKSACAGTPWPREGIGRSPLKNMKMEHFVERFLLELDTQDRRNALTPREEPNDLELEDLGSATSVSGSRPTRRQRFSAPRLGGASRPRRA